MKTSVNYCNCVSLLSLVSLICPRYWVGRRLRSRCHSIVCWMGCVRSGRLAMNELTPKLPRELQRTLEQYYTSPIPRPEFASRLEAQLRQSVQQTRTRRDVPERISFMKLVQTRPL